MKLGEFIVELGVAADNKQVKDFAKAIYELPLSVATGIIALAGLEYELVKVTEQAMNAAVGFQMFTAQTGQSWQELQKWQIVAQQANISAEAVASSVSAVQKNIAQIRMGQGNAAPFQLLGIAPTGSAFDVIMKARQRIREMNIDRATATNIITQMGISPEMIHLVDLTDQELAKLSKTSRGLTEEEQKGFLQAKESLTQFMLIAKQFLTDVSYHLIQDLTQLVSALRQIPLTIPVIVNSLIILAAAFAPITTAIAGLLLVLDDLAAYERGDPSAIAHIGKKFGKGFDAAGKYQQDHLPPWLQDILLRVGTGMAGGQMPAGYDSKTARIVNNNSFNLHGSDPTQTADAVRRVLDRQNSKAEQELNNGGR